MSQPSFRGIYRQNSQFCGNSASIPMNSDGSLSKIDEHEEYHDYDAPSSHDFQKLIST